MLSSPGVVGLDFFCHFIEAWFRSRLPAPLLIPLMWLWQPIPRMGSSPWLPYPTCQHQLGPQLLWQPCHFPTKFISNQLQCQFPLCNKAE